MKLPDTQSDASGAREAIREEAHAKVNLTLEVIGKRGDGYHNLVSIIQTIDLHDVLTVEAAADLSVACDDPQVPSESNLALVAAEALRRNTGERRGAHIHISKNIPVAAGTRRWFSRRGCGFAGVKPAVAKPELSDIQLQDIAAGVGSDVPFLINGGTALVQGRGQDVKPLPNANIDWLLVASPESTIEGKTALMFSRMDPFMYTRGVLSHKLAGRIIGGGDVPEEFFFNVFRPIVRDVFPGWSETHDRLVSFGAREVFVSGAGTHHVRSASKQRDRRGVAAVTRTTGGQGFPHQAMVAGLNRLHRDPVPELITLAAGAITGAVMGLVFITHAALLLVWGPAAPACPARQHLGRRRSANDGELRRVRCMAIYRCRRGCLFRIYVRTVSELDSGNSERYVPSCCPVSLCDAGHVGSRHLAGPNQARRL